MAACATAASAAIPDHVTAPGLKVTGQGDALPPSRGLPQGAIASGKTTSQPTGPVHVPSTLTTPRLTVTGQGDALVKPLNKPSGPKND